MICRTPQEKRSRYVKISVFDIEAMCSAYEVRSLVQWQVLANHLRFVGPGTCVLADDPAPGQMAQRFHTKFG